MISPARVRQLLRDNAKYLSLVMHTREELELKPKSEHKPSPKSAEPSTEKLQASAMSFQEAKDADLQETLARLKEFEVGDDFPYR